MYQKHGAYWLVKRNKWTRLGTELQPALAEYARITEQKSSGMAGLIQDALPHITQGVSPSTAQQYRFVARKLQDTFAEFAPHDLQPRHVYQLRREMADRPNMLNRYLTVLRLVFEYAMEEDLVEHNPCVGIKRLAEGKRDRLLTGEEYQRIYAHAPPRLQVIMDLLRLTGQRVNDVLAIQMSDLWEDGIHFRQQKTGSRLVVAWSEELVATVARAHTLTPAEGASTLLRGRGGRPVDYWTVQDQWVTACRRAGVSDAALRDLRPVAATAAKKQGKDPTALLGHTTQAMTKRYLRDKDVPVVKGPEY